MTIKEYLSDLKWDGTPRLDALFIDYLGAEDTAAVRTAAKDAFVEAVDARMRPGHKADHVVILCGPQGCGKSTLLLKMSKGSFSASLIPRRGIIDSAVGYGGRSNWFIEVPDGFNTEKERNRFKAFAVLNEDKFRPPYHTRSVSYLRRCVFFGATAAPVDDFDDPFFRVIHCAAHAPAKRIFTDLDSEVDQIWAEAVHCWRQNTSNQED